MRHLGAHDLIKLDYLGRTGDWVRRNGPPLRPAIGDVVMIDIH
jgi:hypothetical protein